MLVYIRLLHCKNVCLAGNNLHVFTESRALAILYFIYEKVQTFQLYLITNTAVNFSAHHCFSGCETPNGHKRFI